ncbi:MAG: 30S ribosomal protein S27ae [Sulfolobales archaeon]|nr:30S ribosomal protein S27ae [Sulfolobales archaeon]MCX8209042.1 30S ribosomal protein S27ae [Sulfolobales archaeon]MDW8010073.1 30S ribosomal protein S27ae [Sulfolobales archaeon]
MSREGKAFRSRLYEIDPRRGVARLKNRVCPKCGRVMALHRSPAPRWHCGYCSYTEVARL